MSDLLAEHNELKKTEFVEKCHEESFGSKTKLRKLVDHGKGRYWTIELKGKLAPIHEQAPVQKSHQSIPAQRCVKR